MKKLFTSSILLLTLNPALAVIETNFAMYSDFIWRGTTFSENQPAIQAMIDAEEKHGFFIGSFVSNAEFSDEALDEDARVTSEIDLYFGKRWTGKNWDVQFSYNKYTFPHADVFNADEFNILGNFMGLSYEISYMDDYFGYSGVYKYYRLGYLHRFTDSLESGIFAGYNAFKSPKGNLITRCLDASCTSSAQSTGGAGNPDYIDIYYLTRKTLLNGNSFEVGINWTNRKEYSVENGVVETNKARDFAVVVGYIIPIEL